jgi:hypothetical protein
MCSKIVELLLQAHFRVIVSFLTRDRIAFNLASCSLAFATLEPLLVVQDAHGGMMWKQTSTA